MDKSYSYSRRGGEGRGLARHGLAWQGFTMKEKTTIQISKELKKKLDSFGKKGETYEEIITRLIKIINK